MKACLNCGTQAPDDATACAQCGRSFAFVAGAPPATTRSKRPDGAGPMQAGQVAILIGVVLFVVGLIYTDIDAAGSRYASSTSLMGLLGVSLTSFGIVLWATGYIVHALSFLPGKTD